MYEVIEGILQPLALRIIQKNGIIYIYDLNGAYHSLPQQEIYWVSDDQCMGVDKIVNNAKINLSTYSNAVLMSGEIDFPGGNLTDYENLLNTPTVQLPVGYKYYVFNVDLSEDNIIDNSWDRDFTSFAIHTQKYYLPNNELEYTSFPYFHIQTVLGGEESNGIAYSFCDGMLLSTGKFERIGEDPSTKKKTLLMKTKRILIPAME